MEKDVHFVDGKIQVVETSLSLAGDQKGT